MAELFTNQSLSLNQIYKPVFFMLIRS